MGSVDAAVHLVVEQAALWSISLLDLRFLRQSILEFCIHLLLFERFSLMVKLSLAAVH